MRKLSCFANHHDKCRVRGLFYFTHCTLYLVAGNYQSAAIAEGSYQSWQQLYNQLQLPV